MDQPVPVLYEPSRGCGDRKPGGLYLMGSGIEAICGRLNINIKICPTCGEHLRFNRGYQWINFKEYMGGNCTNNCACHEFGCPICLSDSLEKALFMWVGAKHYTPENFLQEAHEREVSKRIGTSKIPKGIELGKTWVLLAHLKAGTQEETIVDPKTNEEKKKNKVVPAIFYAFRVMRVEKILTEKQAKDEEYIEKLREQGITPVIVRSVKEEKLERKDSILTFTRKEVEVDA